MVIGLLQTIQTHCAVDDVTKKSRQQIHLQLHIACLHENKRRGIMYLKIKHAVIS